ncbi:MULTISPECIES: hypothetical protein [unclassified Psychrobacter]|uniref:hypothetical protein n=1 Tax=unclassified Psychrobacter TaxID=196806 RepID=UPI0025D74FC7|nr:MULTISPECIES: hypothetical protein [unclassified Psychrobacter]
MNIGMAGEVRCVRKNAKGEVVEDTGYQKNLILDAGLDFLGDSSNGNMLDYCIIGSGNSTPNVTQVKLDSVINRQSSLIQVSAKGSYDAAVDGNFYKINKVVKFSFINNGNINISELGLAYQYSSSTEYKLVTRALVRDSSGNPTTISVLADETLEVYYKLWCVFNVTDITGTVELTEFGGNTVQYNYVGRPAFVGSTNAAFNTNHLGDSLYDSIYYTVEPSEIRTGELGDIRNKPTGGLVLSKPATGSFYVMRLGSYTQGSFKRSMFWDLGLSEANSTNIRSILLVTNKGVWQFRYGSVLDDSPIAKNSNQKMSFEFEFSWGRYEGVL